MPVASSTGSGSPLRRVRKEGRRERFGGGPFGIGRRCAGVCAVMLALAGTAVAQPQPASPAPRPAPIDRNGVLILLRTTLLALDDANKTGNYTAFRDLAAPRFSAVNNAAKLGDIVAADRPEELDLSGVAVLDPQLTVLPEIDQNGMLRHRRKKTGHAKQVNFELLYQPITGQWRLFGISVKVGPSGPVAPAPPASPPVEPPRAAGPAQRKSTTVKRSQPREEKRAQPDTGNKSGDEPKVE